MSKEKIRKEIQKLQQTVENAPRVWKYRGRRVVPSSNWKYGDWSKFPDGYDLIAAMSRDVPEDWRRDYFALLQKLKDPWFARDVCSHCAIYQAQDLKRELDRRRQYWEQNGGEEAKEKFYQECGEPKTSEFRKEDAMRDVEWRFYNELAGAKNHTCDVVNYFQCPYGKEWRTLFDDGSAAHEMWEHLEFYDRHWNRSTTWIPPASEMKWFHFNELAIIDVTSFEDVLKALDDGRIDKIIQEHERYMKETGREIWSL
jgi:hypothetical protein